MKADRVEASWDQVKKKWLIRIVVGEEVIRRHSDAPQAADDQTLLAVAQKATVDEGYEVAAGNIAVKR